MARGETFLCAVCRIQGPRNINICARPGGSVTGVTEKLFMCQVSVYVPLLAPNCLERRKKGFVRTSLARRCRRVHEASGSEKNFVQEDFGQFFFPYCLRPR